MSMKLSEAIYNELCDLMIKSLSIQPNNKARSLKVEDLSSRSGLIPWYILNNNENYKIDTFGQRRQSSVMLDAPQIISEYNEQSLESKKADLLAIHNQGQEIMGRLVNEMKDLIKKYPHKYQAQLAEESGLSQNKLHDNNWTITSLFNVMVGQKIIKRNPGRHATYSMVNDIDYTAIPYVESTGFASKLEALCAQVLSTKSMNFTQQIRVDKYRIDFLTDVDGTDLYIEVNGRQHYDLIPHFHRNEGDFEKQLKRDRDVTQYCEDNDLEILWIKYDDNMQNVIEKKIYDIRNR